MVFPVLISEFPVNFTGTDPALVPIELSSSPRKSLEGAIVSIESAPGASNSGDGNSFVAVSGASTVNRLPTVSNDDLKSSVATIALSSGFTGKIATDMGVDVTPTRFNLASARSLTIADLGNADRTPIFAIQGAGHLSPLAGQAVLTSGIVTAIDNVGSVRGFYLQDPTGDGDLATADGIFVFTGETMPAIAIGDAVEVEATVSEFSGAESNLSVTQLVEAAVTVLSSGNALPAAVLLGLERTPPTEVIDNDNLTRFDPTEDAIDFYESLEGTRVAISGATALTTTNGFGEITTLPDIASATGVNARGGITVSEGDFNPERLQIDDALLETGSPQVTPGDRLGPVAGILSYSFNNYELLATEAIAVRPVALTPETTTLIGSDTELTVASYNVENLDPGDGDRFGAIAAQIVNNLNAPDIIGLQEVQDNDGPGNAASSPVTAAGQTLQGLVEAIAAAGGPTYEFIDNPFIGDDTNGGEPGGNIRTAFLYHPNRVELVPGSVRTVVEPSDQQTNPDNPFSRSRLPLVATFSFNGNEVAVVSNHFSSRGGSEPLFGRAQPPSIGGEASREAQARAVNEFVDGILAIDPEAKVIVLGDFNGFPFENFQANILAGSVLESLLSDLPPEEQYTFVFEGNSQALDNILATSNLAATAEIDVVHVNAEFSESQASDHDPLVARFSLPSPEALPVPAEEPAAPESSLPPAVRDAEIVQQGL